MHPWFPRRIVFLLLISLSGCSIGPSVNMPLDDAKLADGYINSRSLDLGHVFIWDTTANQVTQIYRVVPSSVPSASVDRGPSYDEKKSTVSRETNLEMSGVPEGIQASVKLSFINSTDVSLIKYNPREFRDAAYVLNAPELRTWRESLDPSYTDPKYRFVFISRVIDGNEISIEKKRSGDAEASADSIRVGAYKLKISYSNRGAASIKANQAPLTIQPSVFRFRIDEKKNPVEYRFSRDLNSQFNLQRTKS